MVIQFPIAMLICPWHKKYGGGVPVLVKKKMITVPVMVLLPKLPNQAVINIKHIIKIKNELVNAEDINIYVKEEEKECNMAAQAQEEEEDQEEEVTALQYYGRKDKRRKFHDKLHQIITN